MNTANKEYNFLVNNWDYIYGQNFLNHFNPLEEKYKNNLIRLSFYDNNQYKDVKSITTYTICERISELEKSKKKILERQSMIGVSSINIIDKYIFMLKFLLKKRRGYDRKNKETDYYLEDFLGDLWINLFPGEIFSKNNNPKVQKSKKVYTQKLVYRRKRS
jgi:hypothetical protein